jgi:hypothetical protein
MPRRPRWARFLSEISEWDQRFERDRAPWIELAAGLAALTVVVVSLLAAGIDIHNGGDNALKNAAGTSRRTGEAARHCPIGTHTAKAGGLLASSAAYLPDH